MSVLDGLEFVKKVPAAAGGSRGRPGTSPLEKARGKLLADLDAQIALADDPSFEIVKVTNKRDGTKSESRRTPKSWATVSGDHAYITVRFSNKPMPLGGKRGSVVRCSANQVGKTLRVVREWAASPDADDAVTKMMSQAKRRRRAPKGEATGGAPRT